jgi:hypothetical protein
VTEKVRIDKNGNVGIGTTVPSYPLDVVTSNYVQISASTGTNAVAHRISNTGGQLYAGLDNSAGGTFNTGLAYSGVIWRSGENPISFVTNSTNRMVISGAGNVGIGTTSPRSKLDVIGNITTSGNITIPIPNSGVTFNNASRIYDNGTCLILAGRSSRIEVC